MCIRDRDVPKDRETGNYNPFLPMSERDDYEETASKILTMMAADAARVFEKLPILENVDILRNILYAGTVSYTHLVPVWWAVSFIPADGR